MATVIDNAGSASSTTSGATLVISSVNAAVGDWLHLVCAADNNGTNGATSTSTTVTDSAGNTWTASGSVNRDPGAASEGTTLTRWRCQVANALVGGSITMNFSP